MRRKLVSRWRIDSKSLPYPAEAAVPHAAAVASSVPDGGSHATDQYRLHYRRELYRIELSSHAVALGPVGRVRRLVGAGTGTALRRGLWGSGLLASAPGLPPDSGTEFPSLRCTAGRLPSLHGFVCGIHARGFGLAVVADVGGEIVGKSPLDCGVLRASAHRLGHCVEYADDTLLDRRVGVVSSRASAAFGAG